MSRLAALVFLVTGPAMLVSLPTQHQRQEISTGPAVSLPSVHQDLRREKSSSKLVMMYDKHQQEYKQETTEFPPQSFTAKNLTPRRLPPLNPASPIYISQAGKRPTNPNISNLHDRDRAQSEVFLEYEKQQHAFEVSLEQMLMDVEGGWGADWGKEEKKRKNPKGTKNKEKLSPGWQKIWYKRLG